MTMRLIDLEGRVFGGLAVLKRAANSGGRIHWLCRCQCGEVVSVRSASLIRGNTKSCGCLVLRHGHSAGGEITRVYRAWDSMRQRCNNPDHPAFPRYGGRGISVCERWEVFENFLADMGEPPPDKSLDRHPNNDGNYESNNCRWATKQEQNRNTSANRVIQGRTVAEWSELSGITHACISARLNAGWDEARAVSEPSRKWKRS